MSHSEMSHSEATSDGSSPPLPAEQAAVGRALALGNLPPADGLSPALLAYIGDAVYELHIRSWLLVPPKRIRDYHRAVVAWVRAESQAALLDCWQPLLTEAERDLVRRGRNATSRSPRRLSPAVYQRATGLETLIGYLFLKDPARLAVLLAEFPDAPPNDE